MTFFARLLMCFFILITPAFAFEVQILSAVVKDQNIAGASVTLQKNGESSINTTSDTNG